MTTFISCPDAGGVIVRFDLAQITDVRFFSADAERESPGVRCEFRYQGRRILLSNPLAIGMVRQSLPAIEPNSPAEPTPLAQVGNLGIGLEISRR